MTEETETDVCCENGWKKFIKNHWNMVIFWIIIGVIAAIGAVFIYLWFVGDAQSSNMVPTALGDWSLGHIIVFMLHLLFWELLIIGIPVAVAAIAGWMWWKKIPEEERNEYQFFKRSKTENGGEGISFLFFVAFCIKVYLDGNWDLPISSWTLDYVVDSSISILVWGAIVFGIPAIIIGLIWLSQEVKKNP